MSQKLKIQLQNKKKLKHPRPSEITAGRVVELEALLEVLLILFY
jgi:hypothetical protein